jgi:hypothetical protein
MVKDALIGINGSEERERYEEELQIELILEEASRLGIRNEVETFAKVRLLENPELNKIETYNESLNILTCNKS